MTADKTIFYLVLAYFLSGVEIYIWSSWDDTNIYLTFYIHSISPNKMLYSVMQIYQITF